MARPDTLDVFFGTERVGAVRDASPLVFEYAANWLQRAQPRPVAAIPLLPGPQRSDAVQAFFENLLPEGELRVYLSGQRKASTLFAMLLEVAGDTAGGFVLLPAGQVPQPSRYEATTWAALDLRHLVQWVFFNLFAGNNDSHAKNLSIYELPGAGVRLTPFYDLMCTRIYPGLSREFAFSLGGEVLPGQVGREQVTALARELGMGALFPQKTAAELARQLPAALQGRATNWRRCSRPAGGCFWRNCACGWCRTRRRQRSGWRELMSSVAPSETMVSAQRSPTCCAASRAWPPSGQSARPCCRPMLLPHRSHSAVSTPPVRNPLGTFSSRSNFTNPSPWQYHSRLISGTSVKPFTGSV